MAGPTALDGVRLLAREEILHFAHPIPLHPEDDFSDARAAEARSADDPVAFIVDAARSTYLAPRTRRRIRALHELFPENGRVAEAVGALAADGADGPVTDLDRATARHLVDWVAARLTPKGSRPFDPAQYFDVYDALEPRADYGLVEIPSRVDPNECFGFEPHSRALVARRHEGGDTAHFLRAVQFPRTAAAAFQWFAFLHQMERRYTLAMEALSEEIVFDGDDVAAILDQVGADHPVEDGDGRETNGERIRALDLTPHVRAEGDALCVSFIVFGQYDGVLRRTCRAGPAAMAKADEIIVPYNCGIVY